MKKEIKIMVFKKGVITLATKKAENYDEFTYYVGPCKGDKTRNYALIDKNTGFLVCYSKTKKELLEEYDDICCSEVINITEEDILKLQRDLKILEILKYRIHLKEDTIKGAHFTINENGLPEIETDDTKAFDVAFIGASGFVFKDSEEHKLLKEWLENDL